MFKVINGWTKEKMIEHVKDNFKGKSLIKFEYFNSFGSSIGCAYRGDNGAKCGAGLFIPDDKYSITMEKKVIGTILWEFPDLNSDMPLMIDGMRKLQIRHDMSLETETLDKMLEFINNQVEN